MPARDERIRAKRGVIELRDQDSGARRLARLEIAMRLCSIAQRVRLVDLDRDAPFLDEREELGGSGFERRALADEVVERRPRHVERAAPRELMQPERLD